MKAGELMRVRFAFGALATVPVFLAGWLGWIQVAQAGAIERSGRAPLRLVPATADRQAQRSEALPAPRGTILDRNGSVLALDCETYEVRANIAVPKSATGDAGRFRAWLAQFVDDAATALAGDEELSDRRDARQAERERLARAVAREFGLEALPVAGSLPAKHPVQGDVLVASGVDSLAVVEALHRVFGQKRYQTVALHFLRSFQRHYPERDLTHGLVGHTQTRWVDDAAGGRTVVTEGACGLETFRVLAADASASRGFLRDGKGRNYFLAPAIDVPQPNLLHATLDIELQRIAVRELGDQAELAAQGGKTSRPKWGAMVLVDIDTGDVLAAASWHREQKNAQAVPFTPYQSLFEPGSIVKPLVLAYAREAGVLDWDHEFDCTPGGAEYRERIAGLGRRRPVRDDHDCARLSPHGILMNSSNIGAAYVGLLMSREQWAGYMDFYGFRTTLGLRMPGEGRAGTNARSFAADVPLRSFRANSAISFSFGYEMQATVMHVARAYLRLFRGAKADLRLCRGVEVDGRWQPLPSPTDTGPRLRPEVVDGVRAAMVDVVSDDPHATGVHMHRRMLKELGIDLHGVVAGKTGTAVSTIGIAGRGAVEVRNASFVGFLPAEQPRWLAVCVMQKDSRETFYGGSYAAPPVVKLLLQCQQLEQRRRGQQDASNGADGQVGAGVNTPGDSGWGRGAPGTTR